MTEYKNNSDENTEFQDSSADIYNLKIKTYIYKFNQKL